MNAVIEVPYHLDSTCPVWTSRFGRDTPSRSSSPHASASGRCPGLRYPAPGGPGLQPVADALRWLLGTGCVAAVGLPCTWHPGNDAAARLAPDLMAALAGS